jgi:hypothetical protein
MIVWMIIIIQNVKRERAKRLLSPSALVVVVVFDFVDCMYDVMNIFLFVCAVAVAFRLFVLLEFNRRSSKKIFGKARSSVHLSCGFPELRLAFTLLLSGWLAGKASSIFERV